MIYFQFWKLRIYYAILIHDFQFNFYLGWHIKVMRYNYQNLLQELNQTMDLKQSAQKTPKNYLNIRLSTWQKDSHQLYDYSQGSLNTIEKQYELPVSRVNKLFILRSDKTNESILEIKENSLMKHARSNKQFYPIAHITISPNLATKKLDFNFQQLEPLHDLKHAKAISGPGLVVFRQNDTQLRPKGFPLKVGSIVCFGRIKYLVREQKINNYLEVLKEAPFKFSKKGTTNFNLESAQIIHKKQDLSKEGEFQGDFEGRRSQNQVNSDIVEEQAEKLECRICFDTSSSSNQLINVCKCTGSCKYTHFECLKHWVDMRTVVNVRDYCISIEKINCEICKAEIPIVVPSPSNSKSELVLISRPSHCDYVMLEKIEGSQKNILVVKNPPYEGVSIGRDSNSYIKINDISVSRVHAFIKVNKGQFYVFDNMSKFGTLVIQQKLVLEVGRVQRSVQIGRTVCNIVVKSKQALLEEI